MAIGLRYLDIVVRNSTIFLDKSQLHLISSPSVNWTSQGEQISKKWEGGIQWVFGEEKQGMGAELTKSENLWRIFHIPMEQGILPTKLPPNGCAKLYKPQARCVKESHRRPWGIKTAKPGPEILLPEIVHPWEIGQIPAKLQKIESAFAEVWGWWSEILQVKVLVFNTQCILAFIVVMVMRRRRRGMVACKALPSSVLFRCIWVASNEVGGRSPHQNPSPLTPSHHFSATLCCLPRSF